MTAFSFKNYITADPDICHGQPCFKDTRIMVYLVLQMIAAGETIDGILTDYPSLTPEHIKAAYAFAASITETGRIGILNSHSHEIHS